ncbi:putative DNA oxidative demethylase [Helianthus anomalus]
MNHSSFCRLIRPMVPSTCRVGRQQGPLTGILKKQYHSFANGLGEKQPFSLIWPWMKTEPLCESSTSTPRPTYEILGPGMIHLKNYVSLKDQVDIVNICQKWGMESGGFYKPSCQNGADNRQHMCFGRNWDPETRYDNIYTSDGSEPPPIPYELTSLAETAIQDAQAHLEEDELPSMCPDTCSVSFYPLDGRLGLHQDLDENSDALQKGLPVVSISIGYMAEFLYGHTRDEQKLNKVWLQSGDVIIFGGKSRLVYHGVSQICPYSAPQPLVSATALRAGRLSLTLRTI